MKEFIHNVEQMRVAQRNYFAAVARARKTKEPVDWANANKALGQSKMYEQKVDAALPEMLKVKAEE